jgi:hypothetical protein
MARYGLMLDYYYDSERTSVDGKMTDSPTETVISSISYIISMD